MLLFKRTRVLHSSRRIHARPCIPQVSGRFLFEHLASGLSRGRIGSMDADTDVMTLAHAQVTEEAQRFVQLLNERTEGMLETLQVGESLAVHVMTTRSGLDNKSIPARVLFQIVLPGMTPERGREWTVYGPKV